MGHLGEIGGSLVFLGAHQSADGASLPTVGWSDDRWRDERQSDDIKFLMQRDNE